MLVQGKNMRDKMVTRTLVPLRHQYLNLKMEQLRLPAMDIGEAHADHNAYPYGTEWAVEWNGKSVYTCALLDEESTLL
eukprot:11925121-Prorocentrum_lima.AAC.1